MSALNLDGLTDAQLRLFAVRCARRVQHLLTDPRSIAAIDIAERYARGEATDEELAAWQDVATNAARAAAWVATDAAWNAAWAAAWATASAAEHAATWAAEAAARAAASAAGQAATWDAAWDAERAEQQKILDQIREAQS